MISAMLDALAMPGDYTRGLLAGRAGDRMSGSELLGSYGMEIENPLLRTLADFGVGMATDPLTYVLPMLAGKGAQLATKAWNSVTANPGIKNLLPLRRQFTMVKNLQPMEGSPLLARINKPAFLQKGMDDALDVGALNKSMLQTGYLGEGQPGINMVGRAVGGMDAPTKTAALERARAVRESMRNAYDETALGGVQGSFDPAFKVGRVYESAVDPVGTLRHELGHGLMDAALSSGQLEKLPFSWRLAKGMQGTANRTIKAAGELGEEVLARDLNFPGNAMNFLRNPHQVYEQSLRQKSPFIADLYAHAAIPRLLPAAGVVGGGALGAGLGSYLMSQGGTP